jgi:hypothetical protein
MKKCTYCGKEHSDEATTCEIDGQPLEPVILQPKPALEGCTHKKELTRISPLRAGIISGVLYGVMALIFVPIGLLTLLFHGKSGVANAFGGVFFIFAPVLYGILGFIGGIIAAAVYNLVVKFTGGLEFEVRDVPPAA